MKFFPKFCHFRCHGNQIFDENRSILAIFQGKNLQTECSYFTNHFSFIYRGPISKKLHMLFRILQIFVKAGHVTSNTIEIIENNEKTPLFQHKMLSHLLNNGDIQKSMCNFLDMPYYIVHIIYEVNRFTQT